MGDMKIGLRFSGDQVFWAAAARFVTHLWHDSGKKEGHTGIPGYVGAGAVRLAEGWSFVFAIYILSPLIGRGRLSGAV